MALFRGYLPTLPGELVVLLRGWVGNAWFFGNAECNEIFCMPAALAVCELFGVC